MKVTGLDECITDTEKTLGQWQKDAASDQERAAISLAQALTPQWYRWLKESGASSNDILTASCKNFAAMLVEVVANVAKEGRRDELAEAVSLKVAALIIQGVKHTHELEKKPDIMAFRKRDS